MRSFVRTGCCVATISASFYLLILQLELSIYNNSEVESKLGDDSQDCSPHISKYPNAFPLVEMDYNDDPTVYRESNASHMTWRYVKPAVNQTERGIFRRLIRSFLEAVVSLNVTYFIMSGTLLGSYRHHGMTPWDDDIDVMMSKSERTFIISSFENYTKQSDTLLTISPGLSGRIKIFHRTEGLEFQFNDYTYRWPFIEVTFYDENVTHLWQYQNSYILPKRIVFPLHYRPFEGKHLLSPRDAYGVLKVLYRNPYCITTTWMHKARKPKQSIRFDCEKVANVYPFVHRQRKTTNSKTCLLETLMLGDKVVHSVAVNEPIYANSKPFKLQLQ